MSCRSSGEGGRVYDGLAWCGTTGDVRQVNIMAMYNTGRCTTVSRYHTSWIPGIRLLRFRFSCQGSDLLCGVIILGVDRCGKTPGRHLGIVQLSRGGFPHVADDEGRSPVSLENGEGNHAFLIEDDPAANPLGRPPGRVDAGVGIGPSLVSGTFALTAG
jgi:hypothetical protein